MMYATARFNAWLSACGFENSDQLKNARKDTVQYFMTEYGKMLEHNLGDYFENFDHYFNTKNI